MRLGTRIRLGYGYLVVLLIASAFGSAVAFERFGQSVERVLDENFASIDASMSLLEALERQDSVFLAALLGEPGPGHRLAGHEETFAEGLGRVRRNLTLEGEEEAVAAIELAYGRYRTARDALLADRPEKPLRGYEEQVLPAFEEVKAAVRVLFDLNYRAMREADRVAQEEASQKAVFLGLVVALALVSMGFLSRALRREVIDRLAELGHVSTAIARGDRTRRVTPGRSDDELGQVARELNRALDRQVETEATMRGRLCAERQVLLGLLGSWPEPAAVLGPDGVVVASTLDPARGDELGRWRPADEEENGRWRARRLVAPGGREVGWLVTAADPS